MGYEKYAGRAFINFALPYSIAWVISYYAALDWFDCWCHPKYSSPLSQLIDEVPLVLPLLLGISGVTYMVGATVLRSVGWHQFNDDGVWMHRVCGVLSACTQSGVFVWNVRGAGPNLSDWQCMWITPLIALVASSAVGWWCRRSRKILPA